jgi:hypothetical protein
MTKPHIPRRYNRISVFNHCVVYSPYHAWAPSCWNTTSVSQLEAELEAASVQQFADNYLSLCRQCIKYQTADRTSHCADSVSDHTLRYTYIIVIHVCKILGHSLAQAVIRTAEHHSRTLAIRICGGQSGTGTDFLWPHTISPVGIFAPCSMFVLHLSAKLNTFCNSKRCAAFWGSSSLLCQFTCCFFSCYCFVPILLILIFFYMWQRLSATCRLCLLLDWNQDYINNFFITS